MRCRCESGELEVAETNEGGVPVARVLAIPYAAPPVGSLRWRPPQRAAPWDGVRTPPLRLPICPQTGRESYAPAFPGHGVEMTEDCLVLNVWTPSSALQPEPEIEADADGPSPGLPVLVYIHGGAGKNGSAFGHDEEGGALAAAGVCFVSFNYRLGVFGFMAHPELSSEDPHGSSGNYGILDMLAALEWCQRNIRHFGGDPSNVTIMGISSGSQFVNTLICSPLSRGLFHRAVMQSSTDVPNVRHLRRRTHIWADRSAEEWGAEFGQEELGLAKGDGQVELMRAVSAKKLTSAAGWDSATACDFYEPCIDGWVKPHPISTALQHHCHPGVDLLVGYSAADSLGSMELEQHMFECDDLDYAKYTALIQQEFPQPGAAAAALERFFPVAWPPPATEQGPTGGTAPDESVPSGAGERSESETELVDVQLARLSRMLWYDAAKWHIAKTLSRRQQHGTSAAEVDARARRCWFYVFDAETPFSSHCSDATYWNGRLAAIESAAQKDQESPLPSQGKVGWLSEKAQVGRLMAQALVEFCRTGNPNTPPPAQSPDAAPAAPAAAAAADTAATDGTSSSSSTQDRLLLPLWPAFDQDHEGYMQLGAYSAGSGTSTAGPPGACGYVGLTPATRELYEFMEDEYFTVLDGRLGLSWAEPAVPAPAPRGETDTVKACCDLQL